MQLFMNFMKKLKQLFQRFVISMLIFYKSAISPYLGSNCRFYPSCSDYAKESIIVHGFLKGTFWAMWRLLRCNPLSKGGFDPVKKEDKKRLNL